MVIQKAPTLRAQILAWLVHIFTATGLLSAFMALVAIDEGEWTDCWYWLLLCFFIDGVDGTLARRARVKEVLPHMEGKFIDYVIDFATYAIIPAFFFYKTGMTSEGLMPWAIAIILLSAALYYGKIDMTGGEFYFVGFPVLWNTVVFLLFFVTELGPIGNLLVIAFFGLLHFVPLKFAYPSRAQRFFWGHLLATMMTGVATIGILRGYPVVPYWAKIVVLLVMCWFLIMAVVETLYSKKE